MASIFKRDRDKKRRGSYYYFSYQDEGGTRRTKKGFTDRRATEDLALQVEQEVKRRRVGLVDPKEEQRAVAVKQPIEELVVQFGRSLKNNSEKHVSLSLSRLRKVIAEGGFRSIADIEIDSVEAVLQELLDADDFGRKTYNHYVATVFQFCKWLTPTKLAANPLQGIKRLNADVDVRHPRRALSQEEFVNLCKSARESGESIQCYDGEERARIYTISYFTGLRRAEIGSLTPQSFKLGDYPATLTVEAKASKHKKKDVLPLHPELVNQLKVWLKGKKRSELLFPLLEKRRTWLMVKKDLQRVGIPYRTEEGIADFHSCRHTHITELLRNGVSLPEAKVLARHSDVRTTMQYTHVGLDDQARAVEKLPFGEPSSDDAQEDEQERAQRYDSGLGHTNGQSESSSDTETDSRAAGTSSENPVKNGTSVSLLPVLSLADTEEEGLVGAGSIPAAST